MSRSTVTTAAVRFEAGVPAGVFWRESRWRVLDIPTRLGLTEAALHSPWITHPPEPWTGWRFTARSDADGTTYVFAIKKTGAEEFEVLRVYV